VFGLVRRIRFGSGQELWSTLSYGLLSSQLEGTATPQDSQRANSKLGPGQTAGLWTMDYGLWTTPLEGRSMELGEQTWDPTQLE